MVRFLIAEHALLLLKVVIAAAVDDVPQDVQEQVRVDRARVAHDHFWSDLNPCSGLVWTASLSILHTCIDVAWLASLVVPI